MHIESAAEARQEGSAKEWFAKRSWAAESARATTTHVPQAPPLRRAVVRRSGSGSGGAENDAVTILIPTARMAPVGRLISRRRATTPLPAGVTGGAGVCGETGEDSDEPAFVTELVPGWQTETGRERRARVVARVVWLAAAAAARPALARWRAEAAAEVRLAQMRRERTEQWAEAVATRGAFCCVCAFPTAGPSHAMLPPPCTDCSACHCDGHGALRRTAHRGGAGGGSGPAARSDGDVAGCAQALRVCCGTGGAGAAPGGD